VRLSLRTAIPLLLAGMLLAQGTYIFSYSADQVAQGIEASATRELDLAMSRLQGTLEFLLRRGDAEQVQAEISAFGSDPDVRVAFLADAGDRVVASMRVGQRGRYLAQHLASMLGEDAAAVAERVPTVRFTQVAATWTSPDGTFVAGIYPVVLGRSGAGLRPDRVGVLVMARGLTAAKAQALKALRRRALPVLGFIGLMVVVVAVLLHGMVTRRVTALVRATEDFGRGRYKPLTAPPGDDELGRLLGAFDRMAAQVAETYRRLEDERGHVRLLMDSTAEGIYGIDLEGRCTFANRACVRLLGCGDPSELVGRNMHALIHHSDARGLPVSAEDCGVHRTLRSGRGNHADTELFRRRNGTPFPVEFWSFPIRRDGGLVGAVVTFTDITERRRSEAERTQVQAELAQTRKMEAVGLLAGGIAHDFNNLLTSIRGFTDVALEKLPPDNPARDDLEQVRQTAARAGAVTGQLLTFSRTQPLRLEPVDLAAQVREMTGMLARIIGEKVTIRTDLPDDLWPVRGDPTGIDQVIVNLAINGRDAMPDGGVLTVTARNVPAGEDASAPLGSTGPFVSLTVGDTGLGMDGDTVVRVFEPFFTTKGRARGTGLGLSVVYGIVQDHGGWIDVESAPGHGTTFRVQLPAAPGARPPGEPAAGAGADAAGDGARVLVVEDEPTLRSFVVAALTQGGYRVTATASAEEALEAFEREGPELALVFSDVVLPGRSGLWLVDTIRARRPDLPVLLTSGYPERETGWAEIRERGIGLLAKPYTLATLLEAVAEARRGSGTPAPTGH
jgi:PAS domain S-box-containing protein